MKKLFFSLVALTSLATSGIARADDIPPLYLQKKITCGMSEADVYRILGGPDFKVEGVFVEEYSFRYCGNRCPGVVRTNWKKLDVTFSKDGRVVSVYFAWNQPDVLWTSKTAHDLTVLECN